MGEFKKQLEERIWATEIRYDNTTDDAVRVALEVVEEARREYPSLYDMGFVPHLSKDEIVKLAEARNKWYKKWFKNE